MKPIVIKNAVLYKDMIMDSKRPKLLLLTLLSNIIMGIIAFAALGIMQGLGMTNTAIPTRFLLIYFLIAVSLEAIMIFMIVPAITAGCISIEKERQTLEVLLTTRMTPWQIIKGKYLSAISIVLMIIISSIPSLSLVYIYGGIAEWRMLLLLLTLITSAMFVASIGVFFSSLIKNTAVSVILTYIAIWLLLMMSITVVATIWATSAGISEYIYDEYHLSTVVKDSQFLAMEWVVLFLYLNPVVTLFDAMGQAFGFQIDTTSINGMVTVMSELGKWSEHNFFTIAWTPISIVLQLLCTYGLLRASAAFINPLRGRKPKKVRGGK